jgi:hypothetical protein
MAVNLGSRAGGAFDPLIDTLRPGWLDRRAKAETMVVSRYRKHLGLPA